MSLQGCRPDLRVAKKSLAVLSLLGLVFLLFCFDFDIKFSMPSAYDRHGSDAMEDDIGIIQSEPSYKQNQFVVEFLERFPHNKREDVDRFLAMKEEVYRIRRENIGRHCAEKQNQDMKVGRIIINQTLIYDGRDSVAYCQIAKVASSTWCNHFIDLADPPAEERRRYRQALQLLAPKLWPQPSSDEEGLVGNWRKTTSIVIVRNPLSRLVSVYYQKFVALADNKGWGRLNRHIISMFRAGKQAGLEDVREDIPTPEEVVRYILKNLEMLPAKVDQHWRPQHLSCPFCILDFTVYAKQEELLEDTVYFAIKSGLMSKIKIDSRLNSVNSAAKERQFWSSVDVKYIKRFTENWAYRLDFLMFGYSLREYLTTLDIEFDETEIDI